MEYVLIALVVVIAALLVFLIRTRLSKPSTDSGQLLLMQQQIEALRTDVRSNLQHITENVTQQLSTVTNQIQSQTGNIGTRLDTAARVVKEVEGKLGQLSQATQEIKELGQSVSKLEELLRAPKLRGGLGEAMLEDLLKQVLPQDAFEMQYRFRNGLSVDAVVKTSDSKLVPIDAKFPLENFRKMMDVKSDSEKKPFQKAFINDVKKHVDAIAAKYIVPDEGTFDFALMYIPAENVYYETIIKDEALNGGSVYSYALEKRVIPVSPNSFYAYLRVIALGLRGLQVEKSAKAIIDNLNRLQGEIAKVRDAFGVLGSHLDNARKKYEEADKRLTQFEDRLENIADRSAELPQSRDRSVESDQDRTLESSEQQNLLL
jgi:DNA recombination protein RmuC